MDLTPAAPPPPAPRRSPQQLERIVLTVGIAVALVLTGVAAWVLYTGPSTTTPTYHSQVRQYYVASDVVVWNYTPSGINEITNGSLGNTSGRDLDLTPLIVSPSNYSNGAYPMETFQKCIYRQYTDAAFSTLVVRPASQAYLGLDGPVMYAAVGDTLQVMFRNNCPFATSISPLGVTQGPSSVGMTYNGSSSASGGGAVAPGGTWNYTWPVSESAGPGPMDPSSVMWVYTDGAAPMNGTDTGLFGAIIVTSAAEANPNGTPEDVAENLVALFGQMDESQSPFFAYNIAHYVPDAFALTSGFLRFAINGFTYGNMPMITLPYGAHVRWYVADIGADSAIPYWHGNTLVRWGANVEVVGLLPKTSAQLDMWANNSGIWLLDSDDTGDLLGGMEARYTVLAPVGVPALAPAEGPLAALLEVSRATTRGVPLAAPSPG